MRRGVIAAVALVAILAAVVGATAQSAAHAGTKADTITVWVGWSARELKGFKKIVAEYDKNHPDVNVKVGRFEVDCLWRDRRLVVELDTYRYHGNEIAAVAIARWRPLRACRSQPCRCSPTAGPGSCCPSTGASTSAWRSPTRA